MKPQRTRHSVNMLFTPNPDAFYELKYGDNLTHDIVTAVRLHQGGAIIEVAYESHGSGLKVNKIKFDSVDEIVFTVRDPQIHLLEGDIRLKRIEIGS